MTDRELTDDEMRVALGAAVAKRMHEIKTGEKGSVVKGTIRKVLVEKKFGFIRDEHGVDRFFHQDSCMPTVNFESLQEGDKVQFTPMENPKKGPRAEAVDLA